MQKIRFVHTNIISKDWKKLVEFYVNVFQCKIKKPERNLKGKWLEDLTKIESAHINGVHLYLPGYENDGPTLEIFQYDKNTINQNKGINVEGISHIAFAVDDVEQCVCSIEKHGGTTLGETVKGFVEGVGNIHVVYAKDPEGNIIEVQKWE